MANLAYLDKVRNAAEDAYMTVSHDHTYFNSHTGMATHEECEMKQRGKCLRR